MSSSKYIKLKNWYLRETDGLRVMSSSKYIKQ